MHNLVTSPNATLRVSGSATRKLVVRTNMETYSAQLEAATADGTPCSDDEVAAWATAHANGEAARRHAELKRLNNLAQDELETLKQRHAKARAVQDRFVRERPATHTWTPYHNTISTRDQSCARRD